MSEPKSCPFCRGESRVVKDGRWSDQSVIYAVMCCECHAMSRWCESEEEAIEVWNTRAVIPCETCEQMNNPDSFISHLLNTERERTCRAERNGKIRHAICSECGAWIRTTTTKDNYCHNCGAKVKK